MHTHAHTHTHTHTQTHAHTKTHAHTAMKDGQKLTVDQTFKRMMIK